MFDWWIIRPETSKISGEEIVGVPHSKNRYFRWSISDAIIVIINHRNGIWNFPRNIPSRIYLTFQFEFGSGRKDPEFYSIFNDGFIDYLKSI